MSKSITGACLCKAVRYEAAGEPAMVGHCYCADCRRSSGTANCTHVAMPAPMVKIEGQLSAYTRPADSGAVVTRHFCTTCGSAIYSTNAGMPGLVFLRASSLDDPDSVTPQMIVYASRAPKWAAMDPELPTFPEMPAGGPPIEG